MIFWGFPGTPYFLGLAGTGGEALGFIGTAGLGP